MNKLFITIGNKTYKTTKEEIKNIYKKYGFSISFKTENIGGRFREGYFLVDIKSNFKNLSDKLKAVSLLNKDLDKLEVI